MRESVDQSALQPFYQKLVTLVGEEGMWAVFDYYKGSQMTLPLHLYNRELAAEQIRRRFNGHNQAELAHYYGYSQRWVVRVLAGKA
ncbi:Mor transcription activator family protein [Lactiplantibacillus dongliensis]|uniref:Mor transcription activator family protein n=1 Tax=Lactiplantibacillus dongliensis TaxID=2559919 RepID=UPI0010F8BEA2|nr:Mor transcription activator family protein [Lactiplantibacillus dongliensis]